MTPSPVSDTATDSAPRLKRFLRSAGRDVVKTAAANMGIRGLTLASRGIFIVFFARFLKPSELGIYGLFASTIGLAIYILGFEFYTFTTREILARSQVTWAPMRRDQGVFHRLVYVSILPMLLLLFRGGVLPWPYVFWFYILLIGEHLGTELYRLLCTISRSSLANLIYFLRAGIWIYVFVGWALIDPRARRLESVWILWCAGQVVSLIAGTWVVLRLDWARISGTRIDWTWLRRGMQTSFRLFIYAAALWGITTIDRQFLEKFSGPSMVGVYSFYMSIASAIVAFIEAGIVVPVYPRLIAAWNRDPAEFDRIYRSFNRIVWSSTICLIGAAAIGIRPVLRFIGKPIYSSHMDIFWILMGYAFVSLVFRPQHFALYARGRDIHLTGSALAGLAAAALLDIWLGPAHGVAGIAIGTVAGFTVIAVWKLLVLQRIKYRERRPDIPLSTSFTSQPSL